MTVRCANCNCEIGNLTHCPYCGHTNRFVYRAQTAGEYGTVGQSVGGTRTEVYGQPPRRPGGNSRPQPSAPTRQAPTRTAPPPQVRQMAPPAQKPRRDTANIETLLRLILLTQCLITVLLVVLLVVVAV